MAGVFDRADEPCDAVYHAGRPGESGDRVARGRGGGVLVVNVGAPVRVGRPAGRVEPAADQVLTSGGRCVPPVACRRPGRESASFLRRHAQPRSAARVVGSRRGQRRALPLRVPDWGAWHASALKSPRPRPPPENGTPGPTGTT